MPAFFLAGLFFCGLAFHPADGFSADAPVVQGRMEMTDSVLIEKSLQRLGWQQFRAVVEAIPKLRADVEAYGPLGWEFLKTRYATHAWRKNIDKLDVVERRRLIGLIEAARKIP